MYAEHEELKKLFVANNEKIATKNKTGAMVTNVSDISKQIYCRYHILSAKRLLIIPSGVPPHD